MQIKGRVACEINSGDELVATELIFAGAAALWHATGLAVASCFQAGSQASASFWC